MESNDVKAMKRAGGGDMTNAASGKLQRVASK